ncbi:predicted protein [Chaetoceros tenuissimus]|uniref:Uncharacterized protein n=1 Tax=Chaetoceros tenuissimus TaxID=426638 RepID=A0AAD3HCS8_9STRA|nr:predicted protein [Chaetoceros tenuissimus]GFH58453.1 predicted protein [Chaetoceros tenuissimus]
MQGLVNIKLPINLEFIGYWAFYKCDLSSAFLPPRWCHVGIWAFSESAKLTIVHVPQDVELEDKAFDETKLIADSHFGDEKSYDYDDAHEEAVQEWVKNINNDEKYALHRACCSFQPSKQVIFTILEEKGIGALNIENGNAAGITPSQYLKENP